MKSVSITLKIAKESPVQTSEFTQSLHGVKVVFPNLEFFPLVSFTAQLVVSSRRGTDQLPGQRNWVPFGTLLCSQMVTGILAIKVSHTVKESDSTAAITLGCPERIVLRVGVFFLMHKLNSILNCPNRKQGVPCKVVRVGPSLCTMHWVLQNFLTFLNTLHFFIF